MNRDTAFDRIFAKRCVICFFIVMLLFFSCILRVAVTAVSDYAEVQKAQTSFRLKAGKPRGTIFDRNMVPLTNSESKIIAAVSPTPRAVTAIGSVLRGEELESVLERLKSGKPVLCEVPEYIDCDGIACTTVYRHNSEKLLRFILSGIPTPIPEGFPVWRPHMMIYSIQKMIFLLYMQLTGTAVYLKGSHRKLKTTPL